jgi:DNA-binding NarL/FixJ family response regulator
MIRQEIVLPANLVSLERFSILVVDDQRLFREMIADVLEARFPRARVDIAQDLETTLEFLSRRPETDVILLDYRMPDMRGIRSVRMIAETAPHAKIVMLSGFITNRDLDHFREAGVGAAVTKGLPMNQIVDVVRGVLVGDARFEAPSEDEMFRNFSDRFNFTQRELEAFRLMIGGARNSRIATEMEVAEATVKVFLHHVFKKMNVKTRIEAFEIWKRETQ